MKKVFSLVLALALMMGLLTSCGSNKDNSEPTSEPAVAQPDYFPNLLTGEERTADYPVGQRPVAIVVNNIKGSMPQSGINDAEIVYEVVTEGGITRLLCVYSDYEKVPTVGTIRSARDQHIQLMFPLEAIYVHIGGSTYAKEMLDKYSYSNKDLDNITKSGVVWQNSSRLNQGYSTEYTWYTDGEHISNAIEKYDIDTKATENRTAYDFVNYNEAPRVLTGGEATGVTVRFSAGYTSVFNFENGRYYKSQFGAPQIDQNTGAQYSVDNMFVLFTTMSKYPDGLLTKVDFNFGGVGFYFNNGRYEKVRWLKGGPEHPLRIVSMDGTEVDIKVNPGTSYVAVVSLEEYDSFAISANGVDVNESFSQGNNDVEAAD